MKNIYYWSSILLFAGLSSILTFAPFNYSWYFCLSALLLLQFTHINRSILPIWCYAIAYFASQFYWIFYTIYVLIGSSLTIALLSFSAMMLYLASYIVAAFYIFRRIKTNCQIFNIMVLFPSCWTIGEWLRSTLLTGFSWGAVAYSQVNNYFLQGYFALLGSYGVTWLTLCLIGCLFILIQSSINYMRKVTDNLYDNIAVATSISLMTIIAISGIILHNKQYTHNIGKSWQIALVQSNISHQVKWNHATLNSIFKMYTMLLTNIDADLVVLPETAFIISQDSWPFGALQQLLAIANKQHFALIAGVPQHHEEQFFNSAVALTELSQPYYAKHHLVPYGEFTPFFHFLYKFYQLLALPRVGFSAGSDAQPPLMVKGRPIAVNICYENGFGAELLYSAQQADFMLNVSDLSWYGTSTAKDQHLQISQARALENQRYFVQDTNSGLTAIIAPNGSIQNLAPSFSRYILYGTIQGRSGSSPYQRYGDSLIISICLLMIAISSIYSITWKLKTKSTSIRR